MPNGFVEAQRNSTGLLTAVERRVLSGSRIGCPPRVNSDHLTALGLVSMFLVGVCFAVSQRHARGALGRRVVSSRSTGSATASTARLRACAAISGRAMGFTSITSSTRSARCSCSAGWRSPAHMTPIVAAAFLIAYYILSIEIYLATYCVGRFQMSFWGWGPTELRILLAIGALTLLVKPMVTIFGVQMRLFDVGGIVGAVGLMFTAIVSAIGNTRRLYAAEPLPQNLLSQRRDAETQSTKPDTQNSILLCGLRK